MTASPLDRLRRPEYTGDRRCWPCTALNFVLVVGVAAPIGFVLLPAGFVVFVIGVTLIALRGYVVPYTPQFAPRLTAQLPGDFGPTQADPRSDPLVVVDDPAQLLGRLLAAGVIVEDDALFLTSTFEADWERRMATLREASDEAVAAAVADAAPFEASSLVSQERLLVAGENRRDSWLSRPVAVATATGIEALVDYGIDRSVAAAAVEPLRMFLTTCPDCGEPTEESTVHNCCGGSELPHPARADALAEGGVVRETESLVITKDFVFRTTSWFRDTLFHGCSADADHPRRERSLRRRGFGVTHSYSVVMA